MVLWRLAFLAGPGLAMVAVLAGLIVPHPAWAQRTPVVTVKMTVLSINDDSDDDDSLSDADFYVAGMFTPTGAAAIASRTRASGSRTSGRPPQLVLRVRGAAIGGQRQSVFRVFDFDDGLNFGDDTTVDAALDVDFGTCAITLPGISATCGWDIAIDQDDTAVIWSARPCSRQARPASSCLLQSPLIPMPGQPVTIEMETLDGMGAAKIVTEHVIEVNNTRVISFDGGGAICLHLLAGSDPQFFLRCWAKNTVGANPDAEVAETWRRQVRVGAVPERSIPIGVINPPARAVDIVVLADQDVMSAGAATLADEPALQAALRTALWDGFFATPDLLSNQNRFNLWLVRSTGDIDGTMTTCDSISAPRDWDQYAFADSGWISTPTATATAPTSRCGSMAAGAALHWHRCTRRNTRRSAWRTSIAATAATFRRLRCRTSTPTSRLHRRPPQRRGAAGGL